MTGSYSVVLADLAAAASKFTTESGTFKAVMPADGPPCPDGGSAAVNQSLQAVVQLAAALHLQITGMIAEHGAKLKSAHDQYQKTEESIGQMCTDLTKDAKLS